MIRPLADRVLVRPIEPEQVTAAGIILPDVAQKDMHRGTVLAVGPGKQSEMTGRAIPLDVQVGDEVLYSRYGGTEVEAAGVRLLLIRSDDLIGVAEPEDELEEEAA